jgi:hypothetical protein
MTPEQIAPVGLAYPKSANGTPLDHDDDCAFAYGNSGYACYCFVPRAHLDTLTAAVEELPRVHMAPNGWAGKPEDFVQFAAVLAILRGEEDPTDTMATIERRPGDRAWEE